MFKASVKNPLIKNLTIFLGSVLLVLGTSAFMPRLQAVPTSMVNKYVEVLHGGDFDDVISKYHEVINNIFNKRIETLVEKMKLENLDNIGGEDYRPLTEEDLEDIYRSLKPPKQRFDPISGEALGRDPCQNEGSIMNLSTYCISQLGMKEYFEFREAMLLARREEKTKAVEKFNELHEEEGRDVTFEQRTPWGALIDLVQGEKAIQDYGAAINEIDNEIVLARQTLDMSLAAYHEMQTALPLHRKYREVFKELETYRDVVKDVRREIDLYPFSFLDVSTTACT